MIWIRAAVRFNKDETNYVYIGFEFLNTIPEQTAVIESVIQ